MEIIVKSSKVAKTGTNKAGDWKLIVVKDETSGVEYTTFDAKALCNPGTILEIGEPDVKDGKFSFKKCEVISEGKALSPPLNGQPGMTIEMWSEKDRITRASIEGQVAMKCYTDLVVAKIGKIPDLLLDAIELKIRGIIGNEHIKAQLQRTPALVKDEPSTPAKEWPPLKNLGELYARAAKFGISSQDVLEVVGVGKGEEIIDLDEAWKATATKFAQTIKSAQEAGK